MAFSSVMTVLASLCMTIGICFFFGLEFTGGKERSRVVSSKYEYRCYHTILLVIFSSPLIVLFLCSINWRILTSSLELRFSYLIPYNVLFTFRIFPFVSSNTRYMNIE